MVAVRTSKDREAARRNTRMRFEQWANNPTCEANTISAVSNLPMRRVAAAEGVQPTFGQSPFALRRGQAFEQRLFRQDAARLLPELIRAGLLPKRASGFLDLRIKANYGRLKTLEDSIDQTKDLLRSVATAGRTGRRAAIPAVVAGATVVIPRGVMLPEAVLIIDVLAIRTDRSPSTVQVGEIKTYPDRGGHTNRGDLATARGQAGIYLEAMRLTVIELKLQDVVDVGRTGFLVLSRPGSDFPSVRAGEDIGWQADRATRGFDLLERAAQSLPPWDEVTEEALIDRIRRAETDYGEDCISFCDRAAFCYRKAIAEGSGVILGQDVHRFVGDLPLPRVSELLKGARPRSAAETDLRRRIDEGRPW